MSCSYECTLPVEGSFAFLTDAHFLVKYGHAQTCLALTRCALTTEDNFTGVFPWLSIGLVNPCLDGGGGMG
eukprot:scaffold12881_cov22-Tisochrysis_lutea.AAC.2